MIPEYKICSMCKIEKHSSFYHTKKEKNGKTYLKSRCKKCSTIANRKESCGIRCKCGNKMHKISNCCSKCLRKLVTIQDCYQRYDKHHLSSVFSLVRIRARYKYRNQITECQNCRYNKHVEVCHIKPISSYPKDTMIDEINDISNIVFLCPNCHWEFDNGILSVGHLGNAPSLSL